MQVYLLAVDTLLFYDMQVNKIILIFLIQRIGIRRNTTNDLLSALRTIKVH